MEYKSYQHIEKLGTIEVEGILNGTCYLTYKIDGTNACVWRKNNGRLGFGSRKRELSLVEDNQGFMSSISPTHLDEAKSPMYLDLCNYLINHPNHIIYGEWLIPVTLKRYEQTAWKRFYIFDIYDDDSKKYINYDIWTTEFNNNYPNLMYIPLIAKLENPTEDQIKSYLDKTGDFLITEGLGEGIVIKNYDFVNRYGRTTWAKVLTEDFSKTKQHVRQTNSEQKADNATEYAIIKLMTIEHIQKEYNKLIEFKGDWSSKYIFELLNKVFTEFMRDNWEIILKKFKMPIINFKTLKQLSDTKIKETLNL